MVYNSHVTKANMTMTSAKLKSLFKINYTNVITVIDLHQGLGF